MLVPLLLCAVAAAAAGPYPMATPRPIQGNLEYMSHLERSGEVVRAPLRGAAADPVDPWQAAHIKGCSYIPSTARNAVAHWKGGNYSSSLTRTELGYGAAAGMNHVKLTLHYLNWLMEPSAFLANLEDTLQAAAALNLSASLALFEGPGQDLGATGPAFFAAKGYLTSGWLANPGLSQMGNASLLPTLDAYVQALTSRHGADPRVVGWDVLYQPTLCQGSDPSCPTRAFLQRYLGLTAAGVAQARAWVTSSIIPGAEACDSTQLPLTGRTLVAFENYNGNRGAVAGDSLGVLACGASLSPAAPLPVLLTGAIGRQSAPPSGVCETLFEAYGAAFLDIPAHPRVGLILPSLMIGVDEFSSSLNQGLIFPNGSWYSSAERACFAAAVPPVPPPPPGPPPPALNYTTPDGLLLGLRSSTRAVQVLGLASDARWFGNFSFVPPLWNYIPEKPHRDYGGCHHVGDATLRVQPASHSNASEWAFYSTAQASDSNPAQLLPLAGELMLDYANLTQAMVSGGALDARFPLGLHLLRSIERTPGGSGGFAVRWNLSVPVGAREGVRVGGLGFSLISDTFFGGTNNTAIAATGSFLDAHVGLGSGFVTFTRADGSETLLVTPCGSGSATASATTLRSGMEAWRPLLEDPNPPNEGIYEWSVHTGAWAGEWAVNAQAPILSFPSDADHAKAWPSPLSPWPSWHLHETVHLPNPRPWNPPTTLLLQPGQWADYALCFSRVGGAAHVSSASASASAPSAPPSPAAAAGAAAGPRGRDAALAALAHPLFTSVPGYVLGGDMGNATLYITLPPGLSLLKAACEDGAEVLGLGAARPAPPPPGAPPGTTTTALPLLPAPAAHSRARLLLTLSSGLTASVHYYVLPGLQAVARRYGAFAASTSWLPRGTPDSFGRSASFMPWDREDRVHVLQDGRPFVVGLSDDAGGGAALGMGTQAAHAPVAAQVALLDEYISATLLGVKPDTALPPLFSLQSPDTWKLFMTLWYFDKAPLNSTGYYVEADKCHIGPSWCAFNSPWCNPQWCAAAPGAPSWAPATYRQYNYPHQIGVYWGLYLTARNYAHVPTARTAEWYLNASVSSILAANCHNAATGAEECLVTVGLMDGSVFREVLRALQAEGPAWSSAAELVEGIQRRRVLGDAQAGWEGWNAMDNPAGSEFAWDTTGQEEVAVWGAWFNASDSGWMHGELNGRTVDSILGYMTSVPTWAYHGAAYGMGDFSNNAKWMVTEGWEREGGHYRSGLNSIPVIERYRAHPDDFYLLQVGIAGICAPLPNIDADGAPSMAFHTHPFIMAHDPNSGDHGLGYFGSALNSGAYLHNHSALGPLCFLCDLAPSAPGAPLLLLPRDTFHRQAYLEPLGLWLVAEAGTLASVALDAAGGRVVVTLVSSNEAGEAAGLGAGAGAPYAALRLRLQGAAPVDRPYAFTLTQPHGAALERGAYSFPPNADPTQPTQAVIAFAPK